MNVPANESLRLGVVLEQRRIDNPWQDFT